MISKNLERLVKFNELDRLFYGYIRVENNVKKAYDCCEEGFTDKSVVIIDFTNEIFGN